MSSVSYIFMWAKLSYTEHTNPLSRSFESQPGGSASLAPYKEVLYITASSAMMQVIIPLTYALADIWLNLSVYGDLIFTVARTLLLVLMTHLLTWSREATPFAEEETKEQAARPAEDLEDEASSEDSGISMGRLRFTRLTAGVRWQQNGRRRRVRSRRH